jgi:peptide/nickel transport system substrate-binding protein
MSKILDGRTAFITGGSGGIGGESARLLARDGAAVMLMGRRLEALEAKRDALLREGLKMTADNAYYIPIHHQVRPWAMKKNVTTVHRSDDRPEARFTNVGGS